MEILASVITKIGESMVDPIGRQFGYLIHYDRNIEKLKWQIQKLEALRSGLQGSVDAAIRNGEEIRIEVKHWIDEVDEFVPEAMKCLGDATVDANTGGKPNLAARYRIGKHVVKKTMATVELLEEGKFSIISHPAPPMGIQLISSASGNFVNYKTTELVRMKVMEALKDDNTQVIGVHGMAGVGKTTLVKEIGKQVKEEKLFDEVLMSVVSQNVNFKRIQGQMADMLGLTLTEESESGRAGRLKDRLKKVNKVLVILDDVWSRLDVAALGIPFGDEHKGCKVIITTRRQQIFSAMGLERQTTMVYQLGVLSEQESWDLLRRNAGDAIESSSTLNDVAKEISKECRGLPIAIVTVGRALKHKELEDWKEAAVELKKGMPVNIEGVEDDVYKCIKLSYDYLRDEETKCCFLLCSFFPEDENILIESLVRYGMGLRVFKDVDTMREARRRTNSLIKNLMASCLLLESDEEGGVKMHDVVRDVAISIGSNYEYFVRSGVQLAEWPELESFQRYNGISLMSNNIRRLPAALESRNLQILLLQNNPIVEVGASFQGMKELRVLDLSRSERQYRFDISPSFCYLTSLRTLILDGTEVRNINNFGQIRMLEVLSLRGCILYESINALLPQLTRLRVLDMGQCSQYGDDIEPSILSKLSRLEELMLLYTNINPHVLADLKTLERLAVLTFSVKDPSYFPQDLGLPDDFEFIITSNPDYTYTSMLDFSETPNTLILEGPDISMEVWRKHFWILFKRTNQLALGDFKDIKNILPFLSNCGDGLNMLKNLLVYGCKRFQYLIDVEEWGEQLPPHAMLLSNLEKLDLTGLKKLRGILHVGHQVFDFRKSGVFHNLREVHIIQCPRLKILFQPCLAQQLHQLEELEVTVCEELEEIVAKENEWQEKEEISAASTDKNKMVVVFKSLRKLQISHLPNLKGFCTGSFPFEWPSLKEVVICNCPKMKTFTAFAPSTFKTTSNLEDIVFEYIKINPNGANISELIQKHLESLGIRNSDEQESESE